MKKILSFAAVASLIMMTACDLTETQQANADRAMVFGSETGLKNYCYSFYNTFPAASDVSHTNSTMDNAAKNSTGTYEVGAYTVNTSTSWSWSDLRNINYFLKYNTSEKVAESVRNNYNGIARFFRAYDYYGKLVKYGEVPWIDIPLEPDSEELYKARDTRDVIITKIMEDLDYAYQNITVTKPVGNSNEINKWTALALKARVCLFEGTFRKYHAGSEYLRGCSITSTSLLETAAAAAKELMDKGPYKLHTGTAYTGGGRGAYRDLFVSDKACTDEVILAIECDGQLTKGEQNWWYNSSTYGPHLCMTRAFAQTYLNKDGSFYNEKNADGSYKNFVEETTDRDPRLNMTIRAADYTRKNSAGAYYRESPNMTGHSLTGYQITKWVMDDVKYDDAATNDNDESLFRFAETLLVYAEAKAELGTITAEDWSKTIGALRRRAGITGGDLDRLPTAIDPAVQKFYPAISNPVILEIRREREIELFCEGLRLDDLKRWKAGNNWDAAKGVAWEGIWVPGWETPVDINGDGTFDAYFTKDTKYSGEYKSIAVTVSKPLDLKKLQDGEGYILDYNGQSRIWNENMYLYPIPANVITLNPAITQNPGW